MQSFFGTAEIKGDAIKMGPLGSTRMACPEPAMNQEAKYLEALQAAERFEWKDPYLLIYCKGIRKAVAVHADQNGKARDAAEITVRSQHLPTATKCSCAQLRLVPAESFPSSDDQTILLVQQPLHPRVLPVARVDGLALAAALKFDAVARRQFLHRSLPRRANEFPRHTWCYSWLTQEKFLLAQSTYPAIDPQGCSLRTKRELDWKRDLPRWRGSQAGCGSHSRRWRQSSVRKG